MAKDFPPGAAQVSMTKLPAFGAAAKAVSFAAASCTVKQPSRHARRPSKSPVPEMVKQSASVGIVSLSACAPSSESRSVSAAASSRSPISVETVRMTSPASSAATIYMMETPVMRSPFRIAQLMGAAPRYFGRSEE